MRFKPVLYLLPMVLLSFLSCTAQRDDTDIQFVIGVAQANLSEPWRDVMNQEIREAAGSYPDLRVIFTNAGNSPSKQEEDIHQLIESDIDLLIVSPVESREITSVIQEAYTLMPVIIIDKAIEGYDYTLFIGVDNALVGKQAGRYVRQLAKDASAAVIEITGSADSLPVIERMAGFREELDQVGGIELIASFSADWLRDRAEDITVANLALFETADIVFAHNDAMAFGVFRALKNAGFEDKPIIGIDGLSGSEGGLALVEAGILDATITCPTGGKEAVNRAMDILTGRDGLPKKIILRPSLMTQAILAERYDESAVTRRRSPDGSYLLGYVQVGSESDWREANTKSIIQAAKDADVELLFEDAQQDQERQIEAIRSFIAAGVDVIAFSPIVSTGWDEVLKEAQMARIPVICSDRTVEVNDETLVTTYLGADFIEEGRRAAEWILKETGHREDVHIVEIAGLPGSTPAIDRAVGFWDAIGQSENHHIIDSEPGDFYESLGYEVMTRFLVRHDTIDVVYAHNDNMALGAIRAIEEAGLRPGEDILLVSVDGVKKAFQAMKKGKLNCTVECSPLLGPQLMKAVQDYVNGEELPLRINTEEGVFPMETARDNIRTRAY